jgi:protein associated with RNAse G/E
MSSRVQDDSAPASDAQPPRHDALGHPVLGDPRTVRVVKVNHEGRRVFSYSGEVVFRAEGVVVARCLWTLPKVVDLRAFKITPGDIFMEYYYAHEWFNIFVVYDRLGALKGWYCNVAEPTELRDGELAWNDWALDLLVIPDGRQYVVDEDEFEALHPSPQLRAQAEAGLATLQRWATEGRPPFSHA